MITTDSITKWLTLITNIGVIGGLVFVAVEIDQNTTALHAAAVQESTDVAREQILNFANNGELNSIMLKPISELNEEDFSRRFWANRSAWIGLQGQFRQWQLGVLPDVDYQVWSKITCINYKNEMETQQPFWAEHKLLLIPAFVQYVEKQCQ